MKLKIFFSFLLLFTLLCCTKHQSNEQLNNDVKHYLTIQDKDSLSQKIKLQYLDSLEVKLRSEKNDSFTRKTYFELANAYYNFNKNHKYLEISKIVNELATVSKDSNSIGKSLYYIGDYYSDKAILDSAFFYYSKSKKIYTALKDIENEGKITLYLAGVFFDSGDYVQSEVKGVEALQLLSKIPSNRNIYECYNIVGLSLSQTKNYNSALSYFNLASDQLTVLEREGYPKERMQKSIAALNNNIAGIYEEQHNYEKAITHYKKGLEVSGLQQNFPETYAMLLNNLAFCQFKAGYTTDNETLLKKSLFIRTNQNEKGGIVASTKTLGNYFLLQKDTVKGLLYLKKSYALASEIKAKDDMLSILALLAEYDQSNKKKYLEQYIHLSDTMRLSERNLRNKFARIAFETDKIEEEKDKAIKKYLLILLISVLVVLLLLSLFLIYRVRSRNKELLYIKQQQQSNEKIYQMMLNQRNVQLESREMERDRIAKELHDGILNSIFGTRFMISSLPTESSAQKQNLVEELQKIENEIRTISHDLRSNLNFDDTNLPDLIASLIASQKNNFGTEFSLFSDKHIDWSLINSDIKINLYRIIQEALQNVNKYASAEKCNVMLVKNETTISLRIWDNGVGFNTKSLKQGIGIRNMKDRATTINGFCTVTSEKNKGTTIEIVF